MSELMLTGLDGTNPLAFFAALGVLEGVDRPERCRLRWAYDGGWRPVLISPFETLDSVVDRLDEDRRSCVADPALALTYAGKQDLKPPPKLFRDYLEALTDHATPSLRRSVDWAAAFATDVAVDNNGNTKPTALHFTAGQQQFVQMAMQLVKGVTKEHLREALGGPWRYDSPLPVLGWDSTSARDYALRSSDPSTDKKLGVPGADWLAFRGLAFFPLMPRGERAYTTCCVGGWKNGRFRWPLWTDRLPSSVIRTLLAHPVEGMGAQERDALGISAACACAIRRHETGGRGSFQPAAPA